MEIFLEAKTVGNSILEAFRDVYAYKMRTIVKKQVYIAPLGIVPLVTKIEILSLPFVLPNTSRSYKILIETGDINVTKMYSKLNIEVNYLFSNGIMSRIDLVVNKKGNKLQKEIEKVIHQIMYNLKYPGDKK